MFVLSRKCHRDQPVARKGECEVSGGNSDLPAFCSSLADKLTVSTPRLPRQCGLPSSEECQALAEAALCQGDLFAAVKFHLLSSEPEAALHIGIDHVKGTDGPLCVGWWPPFAHHQCMAEKCRVTQKGCQGLYEDRLVTFNTS